MVRVIITRADNEAPGMAEGITEIGCTPLVAPMMEIKHLEAPLDPTQYQAVITTSTNSNRTLAQVCESRDFKLFCIGKASERAAQALGFTNILSSIGNHKNLAIFISRHANPADGPLLYLHGDNTTGNPVQDLRRAGFDVKMELAYRSAPVGALPDDVRAEFDKETPPEFATFMSIRTYRLFKELMEKEGLLPKLAQTTAVCISPAVADFVRGNRWKKVLVSKELSAPSIINTINEIKEGQSAAS